MMKRKALVWIFLMVISSVILYAQPSMEELSAELDNLQRTIQDLKTNNERMNYIITFLKDQQSSTYQNADNVFESVNRAIENLTMNVDRLSDLVTVVVLIVGIAFPIVTFFVQSRLDKKRIDQVDSKLDEVREEAKETGEKLEVKLEQAKNSLDERIEKALSISFEAKKWADKSKASEFFNRAYSGAATLRIDEQVQLYSEAIKLDPENADAYFYRGLSYGKMKEYDKAISDYSESIRLNPSYPYAYNNRGVVRATRGEFDLAKDDLLHAIAVDPKEAASYNSMADLLRITKKLDEAENYAKKAIEINPRLSYSYGTLAEIYSDLNDDEKFYEFLDAALKRKYPLLQMIEDDRDCKAVYATHKDEERFKELVKKYNIEIPDDVWK